MSECRQDFLKECNEHGVALQEFQETFCKRCVQPECTRSIAGSSKFESRVSTWHERLFANIPKMDPKDPRYASLSGKRFLTIASSAPEVQSAWIDPTDLTEPTSAPVVVSIPTDVNPAPIERKGKAIFNTPYQARTIGSGPPVKPKTDAWAAPATSPSKDSVVAPGAKIKLGGSGV